VALLNLRRLLIESLLVGPDEEECSALTHHHRHHYNSHKHRSQERKRKNTAETTFTINGFAQHELEGSRERSVANLLGVVVGQGICLILDG
jgi:hypothetical protein